MQNNKLVFFESVLLCYIERVIKGSKNMEYKNLGNTDIKVSPLAVDA